MAREKACAFCAIAHGGGPADRVYEDAATLAFLDRSPLAVGHCLLIPKLHVQTIFDSDETTTTAMALAARRLAIAVKAAFAADGVFVAQNNGVSQSVPHLHVHVVPRFKGDGLFAHGMLWKRVKYRDDAHRAETAETLRKALL